MNYKCLHKFVRTDKCVQYQNGRYSTFVLLFTSLKFHTHLHENSVNFCQRVKGSRLFLGSCGQVLEAGSVLEVSNRVWLLGLWCVKNYMLKFKSSKAFNKHAVKNKNEKSQIFYINPKTCEFIY